jgi:hypothetical protein
VRVLRALPSNGPTCHNIIINDKDVRQTVTLVAELHIKRAIPGLRQPRVTHVVDHWRPLNFFTTLQTLWHIYLHNYNFILRR